MSTLSWVVLSVIATALACALIALLSRARGTPFLKLDIDALPEIEDALPMLSALSESVVFRGNSARVFQNQDAFAAMFADIANATCSVHLETFVWNKGAVEQQFVDALSARARAGVKVRVLVDSLGGSSASPDAMQRLVASGAELTYYCRPSWWNVGRFNHRTHRKLLVIDGHIAYAFGHGVSDHWLGQGESPEHWRDTAIRMEGPVVNGFQSVFSQNWIEETHELPVVHECFPLLEERGDIRAHVVSSASGDTLSSVAMLYTVAISMARREVIIQNPYFAPNPGVVQLLAMMVKRGVAVHLMVPGSHTDSAFVRYAGSHLYDELLSGGVRLYEFKPSLLHQKIVIIDEIWSHVGSTNFDDRSLALNEEVGVGVLDRQVAAQLKQAFQHDLKQSHELTLERWRRRPFYHKLFEPIAYLAHHQV